MKCNLQEFCLGDVRKNYSGSTLHSQATRLRQTEILYFCDSYFSRQTSPAKTPRSK